MSEPNRKPLIYVLATLAGLVASVVIGVLVNAVDLNRVSSIFAGGLAIIAAVATFLQASNAGKEAKKLEENAAFQEGAKKLLDALTLPSQREPSLQDELADASQSLSKAVTRLRSLIDKAELFEEEVKQLTERAEAVKATAKIHEDDARRISLLLGADTEARLRGEIANLKREHQSQIDSLRRSGNKLAIWTFIGGVLLGVIGNVIVALISSDW